jgi:hypothetical protein
VEAEGAYGGEALRAGIAGLIRPALAVTLAFMLTLLPVAHTERGTASGPPQAFWSEVYKTYRLILELHDSGIDTSNLTSQLNRALILWEEGNRSAALNIVRNVEVEGGKLRAVEGQARLRVSLYRYGIAASLLSIAPLTYFLLPRVYIEAWYRSRRRWVVEHEASR